MEGGHSGSLDCRAVELSVAITIFGRRCRVNNRAVVGRGAPAKIARFAADGTSAQNRHYLASQPATSR
jgi:hypothetical protein